PSGTDVLFGSVTASLPVGEHGSAFMAAPSASVLRHLSRAALISAVAIAAFCDAQAQVLAPPVVTVVAGVKQIELSWPVVAGASYYVVKESPSLGAPFTAISPQLPQGKPWEP